MLLLTTIVSILFRANVFAQTDLNSSRTLPPLHSLHDYKECFARSVPATYCQIFAVVQPNNHSDIWYRIEDLSKDSQHRFRHNHLFFGLCVDQCREILQNVTINLTGDNGNTMDNEVVDYYRRIYADDTNKDRQLYHNLLHKCVNYEFQQKYNLTLSTFVEYCNTNGGRDSNIDYLQMIAYGLIAALVFGTIFCSMYDYYLKCRQNSSNPDYYGQDVKGLGSSLLTSFSIFRNFKKVTAASSNSSDLQFTYFFRFFVAITGIIGHWVIAISALPLKNPEFIENLLARPESIIIKNSTILLQIFFVLAGFLLRQKFYEHEAVTKESSGRKCISLYILGCLHRYLRLIPTLAIYIFFNASLLAHLVDGPLWRHAVDGERVMCTKYWWKNIFMVNNIMFEDSCSAHTWYLATDMQLFALYLMVLILVTRFTWMKKPLYILLGLLSFVIPGVLNYVYRFDVIQCFKPELFRYIFFNDCPEFEGGYIPFYCNLGGYLVGIICAEISTTSERFKRIKASWEKYTKVLIVQTPWSLSMLAIAFGLLFSGLWVINRPNEEPSLWVAIYYACYVNLWAIFGGYAVLAMLLKFGGIGYKLCSSATARILGRITFQIFLWHVAVLRILFGFNSQPIYLSNLYGICHITLGIFLTTVVAFVMTILVEYPIGTITNCLLNRALNTGRASPKKDR